MHTSPGSGVLISARSGFYLGFVLPFGGGEAGNRNIWQLHGLSCGFPPFSLHAPPKATSSPLLPCLTTDGSLPTKCHALGQGALYKSHAGTFDTRFSPSPRRGLSMKREREKLRFRLHLFSFWHKCGYRDTGAFVPAGPHQNPLPDATPPPPVALLLEFWGWI